MQKLISYNTNSNDTFSLSGELQVQNTELVLEFRLTDPQGLFAVPPTAALWSAGDVLRQDGLWQATCFEAFLQPSESSGYYEFNFALTPAWNAYQFTSYREPQPPKATADFVLTSMSWEPAQKYLCIQLENKTKTRTFRAGLTAILQEKTGAKHYYALTHKGSKPDFHVLESFILQRGS